MPGRYRFGAAAAVLAPSVLLLGDRLHQSTTPSVEEIRQITEKVFERPEFDESPGWFQRALDWISRHLPSGSAGSGGFAGAAGELLAYALLVLLGLLVIAVVWVVVRGWVRRNRPVEEPEADIDEDEPERTVVEWRREAERFEADGAWREALRCRYRELVGRLAERGAVSPAPGRTTGELRADMAGSMPELSDEFDEISLLFELAWYADLPTGEAENQRVRALSDLVLAAPVLRRVDQFDGDHRTAGVAA